MVTQIQLGNISTQNGRTVVTGNSGGGLDIKGLIDGLTAAKRLPAVILEGKIKNDALKATAYDEMKTTLNNFRDAANFLRNVPGVQNSTDNLFQYRTTSTQSNTAISGDNYLNVTAEAGAQISSYNINITSIATQNIKTTNTFATIDANTSIIGGAGDPLNAGTLVLGSGTSNITLAAGDTLNQVVAKINAVKNQNGVEATAIQVSTGNYRLSFKTINTGTAENYDITTPNPGIFNAGFSLQTNATDAVFTLDNTSITRSTNSVADVINGITFNLQDATPVGTTINVDVKADTQTVKQGILNFVNSYNELRIFEARQTEIGSDGKNLKTAVLAQSSALRLSSSKINAEIGNAVAGITATDPSRLSDIGITFGDFPGDKNTPFVRNILTIDSGKLDSALANNFNGVRKVFEFDYTTDDPALQVFSRTNSLNATNISLNIDQTNGVYQATYDNGAGAVTVNLDMTTLSSGGITLTGQTGTDLEGLQLIYGSTGNATIQLNVSQGIADRTYNAIDNLLEKDTGIVESAITSLGDKTNRMQDNIDRIDTQIKRFREQLITKFSILEKTISSMNTLLSSLTAQSQARNNN